MKSFSQIPNSLIRSNLSPMTKTIFIILASYNPSFPSYTVLMKQSGMAKASVRKAIKDLSDRNIISYKKGSLKSKRANEYEILPESSWNLSSVHVVNREIVSIALDEGVLGSCGEPVSVHVVNSNNTKVKILSNSVVHEMNPEKETGVLITPVSQDTGSNPKIEEHQSSVHVVNREMNKVKSWLDLEFLTKRHFSSLGEDLDAYCFRKGLSKRLEVIKYCLGEVSPEAVIEPIANILSDFEGVPSDEFQAVFFQLSEAHRDIILDKARESFPGINTEWL